MMTRKIVSNYFTESGVEDKEPYIGPRPYRRDLEDRLRFFGRELESKEIVSLITSHRLVLIYAQSGAGKTSILNAQVIPILEGLGFDILPTARVYFTSSFQDLSLDKHKKSSSNQNIYTYNAMQNMGGKIDSKLAKDLALFEYLDECFPLYKDENQNLHPQILIFDQLEELFSYNPGGLMEQQKGFFEQITDALENNSHLKIVFVIREDYLAQLDPFKSILPEKLRPRFRLERLNRNEAISAIKGPLKEILNKYNEEEKRNIEKEIDELISDLIKIYVKIPGRGLEQIEGDYIEPIHLQVVCRRWWRERNVSKKIENNKNYIKELANVGKALEDFYEEAIFTASKKTNVNEEQIRTWFQENLITASGTRSIIHRGDKTTGGLNNEVIDILADKYIIRREWRSGAPWYELTHD